MMRQMERPTAAIKEFARSQPGGVIRWGEAERLYLSHSENARRGRGFHMNLKRIFDRHFVRVDGIRGFYVLASEIVGED